MSHLLVKIVVLEGLALVLLWLVRAPQRAAYVLALLALVPVGLGVLGREMVPAGYVLVPATTAIYLIDRMLRSDRKRPVRGSGIVLRLVALLFFIAVLAHYFHRPVIVSDLMSLGRSATGIRVWMGFGIAACYFIVFSGVAASAPDTLQRVLKFTAWLCLALCIFGFLMVYVPPVRSMRQSLDGMGIVSQHFFAVETVGSWTPAYRTGSGGYRVGTLGLVAPLLLMFVLSSRIRPVFKLIAGVFCAAATFQSGARAEFAGLLAATLTWSVVTRNPRAAMVLVLIVACGVISIAAFADEVPPLFRRTLGVLTGDTFEHEPRVPLFAAYEKSIKAHPLFGTGFAEGRVEYHDSRRVMFMRSNLRTGGHGTYHSILYLFGLAGFLPFIALLVLSLFSSHRLFRERSSASSLRVMALFCFLCLVYLLFPMTIGGNGDDPRHFLILGIVSGLAVRASTLRSEPGASEPRLSALRCE